MNEIFVDYLETIGITEPIKGKIDDIINFSKHFCPEEIDGIFVTDYVSKAGERIFENLWLFSENYMIEVSKFIGEETYDIAHISNIRRIVIRRRDYDFDIVSPNSRMYIRFIAADGPVGGDFKASGNNCKYLKQVFLSRIKPRLL